ncbi:bifunctional [glutamate--ammonia ligase]-adenylyl-L-tyrosine phosphorylase/[glutamate--ammonia-ligase] adenylyltransferase [Pseudoxanthomonas sp. X-1]|uniref:bifunctional [glutamate--ammonia ligase]-adenylyl-L-tyrosine phosphorylase/[glutamate--ammonia-ligase] adenylyltransferase n=1 Tax=Pseudoxanthomonas sp. X-1 TaxID=2571115 RepID=UPI00110BB8F2|nr:bifunctional [glutamate--ammonia ligase]-adenylyl-L-tyrosine phosphorylase/[glutamate--ammonia-ligase] adenylyltransferase [Pseudoxanthomonas sp. X-1]TMN15423.1 bifunctional [glutamate--ammonia ligase]-adenylyl-L-tyrosine phosphorylase/[glutamate--ammonia-ligase] adenylyltransferase [Pseudoxanthomonas sp. X-1]UAY73983.1 bifunctional [glutamate--ammonia ligase]-adenylyl-L-tyrosine phosphorylase/[glutamate--ammonia-ligase] adenylyltransferase [Pseudoxanthomonas sp. X-1]
MIDVQAHVAASLRRLIAAAPELEATLEQPQARAAVEALALVSDFAIDTLCRQPALLDELLDDAATAFAPPDLRQAPAAQWPALLRRFRAAESTRLVWRDVVEGAEVDEVLAGSTALAEACLHAALDALEDEFAQRHGVVRDAQGQRVRLVVFGLGKLGGGELNFSSDIDLVYAFAGGGESEPFSAQAGKPRALAAEEYFSRLGQRLARLLDETTAEGFSHRVDLRLRPYGSAGRVALSFAAMDRYFQTEGRDWERYAWLKARAVAGDVAAGEAWLRTLQPFVYRRYLDFTALDGLRAMKAMITAEVARRELADDIKRGPGGIREIEFLAQALQLVHGGRDARLRQRGLRAALQALVEARLLAPETGIALGQAYRFLRVLENRLQMLRDAQTHVLPDDPQDALRIARGLGHADSEALRAALAAQRAVVGAAFAPLMAAPADTEDASALAPFQRMLEGANATQALEEAGFADAAQSASRLQDFLASPGVAHLSDSARARLERVLPAMLQAAAASDLPDAALQRCLALLQSILRRTSYLALLDEVPSALARLVDVVARSAWLAERVAQYPLLLDELLDARAAGPLPDRAAMQAACAAAGQHADPEQALRRLNETRLAFSFRIALAALDARQPPHDSARQLAWLADAVCVQVLAMARASVEQAHGRVPGGQFGLVGYGSLGGLEMGFGSDLDLVFLYDAPADALSEPAQAGSVRALEPGRYYARVAQKVVALLETMTGAGRLYAVDVRLRPDGAKGLLVTSRASYADYQRQRAWTWEHQALVRARPVVGDAALLQAFERIRADTLGRAREAAVLRQDVVHMRARMRAELDRSGPGRFDLKQGAGGLVDLEFLLQARVLEHAAAHPAVLAARNTRDLIAALAEAGLLEAGERAALLEAHATLLAAGLSCTLDRRPRLTAPTPALEHARQAVTAACRAHGLAFAPGKDV